MPQLNASPLGLTLDSGKGSLVDYGDGVGIESRFNHPNDNIITFTPWPNGPIDSNGVPAGRAPIHTEQIYDLRLKNIIEVSETLFTTDKSNSNISPVRLKAMDFAYLKNVGVFPNNRLMIARRYGSPVVDDPNEIKQNPISTMISWVPDGEDFLKFNFGEKWGEAKADFTDIFNNVGKDIMGKVGSELGGYLGAGAGAVPLPGFTEGLQRDIMKQLGIIGDDEGATYIPSGEPNIIKEAKQRQLVGYGDAGSSLIGKVSIKMVCEWEQKFIGGIDPSLVFMDILNTVLKFGTSPAKFYLGKGVNNSISQKTKDLLDGLSNNPIEELKKILSSAMSSINNLVDTITKAINGDKNDSETGSADTSKLGDIVNKVASSIVSTIAKKYKVQIMGVINSLSGAASTPWHITIGNPMRPLFCSGDMLVEDVNITLGTELAFNDLPMSIKAEFTLTNARNIGMDEILAKFNVGYMRTVTVKKDLYTSEQDSDFISPTGLTDDKNTPKTPQNQDQPATATNGTFQQQGSSMNLESYQESEDTNRFNTGPIGENRVGNTETDNSVVNPDANSESVLTNDTNNSSFISRLKSQDDAEDSLLNLSK